MDWMTAETLYTVGGAATAVVGVTAMLKALLNVEGRRSQAIAAILSLVIAIIVGSWGSAIQGLVSILNAVVIWSAAMGIDQAVNYQNR